MHSNWKTHTVEWRNERLIDWLKRPLPTLNHEYRKRVADAFLKEEWVGYPYLMIDNICKVNGTVDEVVKWAIYYTLPDAGKDEEYRRLLGLNV